QPHGERRNDALKVAYAKRLRGWRFWLLNLTLGLGHMVVLFNAGSYIALMPHVAGGLGGMSPSMGTWAQTDFMIALALAFPIARWLSGRYGDYPLWVAAFLGYAAASALCAVSDSIWLFLPARIVLGFAGGVTLPIGQSLMLKEYPDRLKSLGLGVWGLFTVTPLTLGCFMGGWIADEFGWRALFGMNIVVALAIAGITGACCTAGDGSAATGVSISSASCCSAWCWAACKPFSTRATTSTGSTRHSCEQRWPPSPWRCPA
ncbi:MFS transporter, partial [Methylogaea oryzae]|uniref:MFS transporter n=1 Tax=Methylogaea oryzae TaxID=1295382 RepID=UPI000A594BA8